MRDADGGTRKERSARLLTSAATKKTRPVLTLPRLERLHCDLLPAALLPLRESATLQSIEADACPGEGSQGARPVAEFWRACDAWKAKQPK